MNDNVVFEANQNGIKGGIPLNFHQSGTENMKLLTAFTPDPILSTRSAKFGLTEEEITQMILGELMVDHEMRKPLKQLL